MKRILLSLMAILAVNIAYGQVKATSAELNAGVDDAKFATALALQGSKYLDQSGAKLYAVTAAGANAYTAAIAPAITAYSAGQVFFIKITTANTGASTLNLNGLGIKSLVKDAATALVGGDLLANRIYAVAYDGTNFQVVNVADALKANLVSPVFTGIPTAPTAAAGTNTIQLATTAFVSGAVSAIGTGASDLALGTATPTTQPITNSNGTGVTLPAATGSAAGLQSAADKTKLNAITGTNTGDQSLSTTGIAGNITISAGNDIGLTSLQRAATGFEDANAITNTGFYTASTSSSATNYAAGGLSGMGIHVVRNSGDALGSFSLWKPTTGSDALYFRSGIGATGVFSAWDIVAGRNWTQTQINTNFIGNGFNNGNTVVSATIDANAIVKSNVGYANISSTNLPTLAVMGGILSSAMLATPVNTFQTYGHIGAEDSYWFRKQISGTWGTWYQVASRNWASSTFIQNGTTQQLNSNFNISGTGTMGTSITGQLGVGNSVLASTKLYVNTQNDAVIGLRVRANSATQSANLQEWQTSAGTAQTVVDNAGNLGVHAGANLYNIIGTDQQTIYNPAYYYSTAATTGAIVFKHATLSAATMFDIKLKFYRYNTNTSLGELRISFYKPDAILINSTTGKYAYTIGNPPIELDQVRVGFDASGNLSIILSDVGTAWNTHNRVIITEVTTSYTGGTNSAWRNGWTSAVETDLSAYTSLTALPITNMSLNGFIQNSALGQTADLRITGVGLFGGRVTAGTISNLGQFTVVPAADATKGQVIRAFSPTQSGNLYEAQTSTGAINFSVSPTGSVATVANMIAGVSFIGNDFRNTAASNNSNLQLTNNGTTISRNIADANDVLAINNINTSSTGLILDAQAAGSTVASISKTGLGTFSGLNIAAAPVTSAGTYDVLTRNTTTGVIEKAATQFQPLTAVANNKLLGRYATGSGAAQDITLGSGLTLTSTGVLHSGYEAGVPGAKIIKISNPAGGQFKGTASVTGAIKIKLPSNAAVMYTIKGTLFQYDGTNTNNRSTGFLITCYALAMANGFSATFTGNNAPNYPVRWYTDGTNPAIYIGELTSTWSYVKVTIDEVQASHSGATIDLAADGWAVTMETAFTGTLAATQLNTLPFSNLNQPLAGFTAGADNALSQSDTQIGAFGKIQGQLNAIRTGPATAANVVYAGPITGTANPTFRKLQRSDLEEAFGAATTSGVLDWNDITNTQPGFSPTLITGASANGPGGSAYYHPFTMEHSSKTGSGNMTQIGYPYNPGVADGITWRWRYSNIWSAWRKVWDSSNFTNLSQLTTRNFSDLQGKPTSLTGYGIIDGATSASVTAVQASVTALDGNAVHKAGIETITGTKFFNGGMGIGLTVATVPSAYKLAVGGGIIAESVKVKPQGEWPDYVFEKGYPMLSLGDLEKFILKNKHLPDVPAASEVKKEGLDLGEMDSKLLKKIEELTLYLIDLKKENETLKERLDKLEKK